MRETIKIGSTDVDMLSNGASPFIYKRIFKKDAFSQISESADNIGLAGEVGFVMHLQTVKTFKEILDTVKIEDFYEWTAGFEAIDIPLAATKIISLFYAQQVGTVDSKKK